jgi:hypothetical protein
MKNCRTEPKKTVISSYVHWNCSNLDGFKFKLLFYICRLQLAIRVFVDIVKLTALHLHFFFAYKCLFNLNYSIPPSPSFPYPHSCCMLI